MTKKNVAEGPKVPTGTGAVSTAVKCSNTGISSELQLLHDVEDGARSIPLGPNENLTYTLFMGTLNHVHGGDA